MKFVDKVRNLSTRAKVAISTAVATVGTSALAVCASADEPTQMETALNNAGTQLTSSFSSLVNTMIPVILGILGSGLVIFGIFALIKLAKKIFGKVAG